MMIKEIESLIATTTRTQALCLLLGWQGGTVHQVADKIGCSVKVIVSGLGYRSLCTCEEYLRGWFTVIDQTHFDPIDEYGNELFWLGAADAKAVKGKISI